MLVEDDVAVNPAVAFRVETFAPTENFTPSKPYQTRLLWRDGTSTDHSCAARYEARNGDRDRKA